MGALQALKHRLRRLAARLIRKAGGRRFADFCYRSQMAQAHITAAALVAAIDRAKLAQPVAQAGAQPADGGNLQLVRALGIPLRLVIHGYHSPDWQDALEAHAPVWDLIPGIASVAHGPPGSLPSVPPPEQGGAITLVLPMLEAHIREVAGCPFQLCPSPEALDLLEDKALFAAYASASDIRSAVPQTYGTLEEVRFPCVVKSTRLNAGQGISVARSRKQMLGLLDKGARHFGPQIVQAAVSGRDEFVTHAVCRQGRLVWWATFERRLEDDLTIRGPGEGREIFKVPTPAVVLRVLGQLAASLAYDGPLNADYKIVGRELQLFEVNPRLGGSLLRHDHVGLLAEALEAIIDGALEKAFAEIVRQSPWFCEGYYRGPAGEALPAGVDLALHYLRVGAAEGRDPGKAFSTRDYLQHNPDVVALQCNPLLHHELSGRRQDRILRSPGRTALTLAVRRLQAGSSQADGSPSVRTVSAAEAQDIINRLGLVTVADSWHHSWNVETFWPTMFHAEIGPHSYVFHPGPSDLPSNPLPMFSNDATLEVVMARPGRFSPFWFLRLDSFGNFLARRTCASGAPRKHFPTTVTYEKTVKNSNLVVKRKVLSGNEELLIALFSKYKDPKYNFSGAQAYEFYVGKNQKAPKEWFFIYMLMDRETGSCEGVALTIEDGRSATFLNLATRRGTGVLLLAQMVEQMCARGYSSMNAGVSAAYGSYKSMIFLDQLQTDATGFIPLGS